LFGKAISEGDQTVNSRHDTEQHNLLRQTVAEMAAALAVEDIKFTDYLKLVQFRDELEGDLRAPITAGWTSQWQRGERKRDG
jgi:hypothetical protein